MPRQFGASKNLLLTGSARCNAQHSGSGPDNRRSPVLSASNIRVVKSGKTILDISSIEVFSGEALAVIGPNGAGKSTLLSVLAALEFPDQGSLLHLGRPVTKRSALAYRRSSAMVFQEPLLLDGSALDNVMLGLNLRGRREGAREKAMEWLDRFGVAKTADQPAHTLSGGEAQRVALARAFVLEPEILLMDEPFSSVDIISRQELIEVFRDVRRSSKTTTVLVTHDFREVSALASRVLVLDQGKVDAAGTPDDIASHPKWGTLSAGLPREDRTPFLTLNHPPAVADPTLPHTRD